MFFCSAVIGNRNAVLEVVGEGLVFLDECSSVYVSEFVEGFVDGLFWEVFVYSGDGDGEVFFKERIFVVTVNIRSVGDGVS